MENNSKDEIPLKKCSIESEGTVTCTISKDRFNDIQKKDIKPKRVIFEVE